MNKQMRQLYQDKGKPSPYYTRVCEGNSSYIVGAHPCGRPRGGEGSFPLTNTLNVTGTATKDGPRAYMGRPFCKAAWDGERRATRSHPGPLHGVEREQEPSPLRNDDEFFQKPPLESGPRVPAPFPPGPRPYRIKGFIIGLPILLAIVLFLLPLPASARTVTNTGRIYGQLMDGSKRSAPVAGQSVTLQMAQGENARDLTTVTTDAQGRFSFTSLNTDKTINYALYTLYQGAQYYTDLIDLGTKPVQLINLKVYDSTASISNLAVVQANMLVDNADAQSKLITISENYVFENLGLTTYVGSLQANGSKPNALRFSLPKNARNVSLKSGFDGYQVIQVDTGFATNAAVPPGLTQFSFSFQVPYTTSSYDFAYTVVYPTVNLSLLVPVNIHASSAALNSQGPVNANQQTFQQFNARKLLPGAQIHVHLDGLPLSQQSASSQPLDQNTRWVILAILLMLAIVGVTWLVYQLSRRRARKRQEQSPLAVHRRSSGLSSKARASKSMEHGFSLDEAVSLYKDQQEALLQELLNLDKAYEAGTINKSEYDARRASTKAELRTLMNKDIVEQSATVKKTARSSGKGAK